MVLKLNTLSLSTMVSTALFRPGRKVAPPVRPPSSRPTVRSTLVCRLSMLATVKVRMVLSPLAQLKVPVALV